MVVEEYNGNKYFRENRAIKLYPKYCEPIVFTGPNQVFHPCFSRVVHRVILIYIIFAKEKKEETKEGNTMSTQEDFSLGWQQRLVVRFEKIQRLIVYFRLPTTNLQAEFFLMKFTDVGRTQVFDMKKDFDKHDSRGIGEIQVSRCHFRCFATVFQGR
jgi:hypothetical protein